jgi:hypothetical protein
LGSPLAWDRHWLGIATGLGLKRPKENPEAKRTTERNKYSEDSRCPSTEPP